VRVFFVVLRDVKGIEFALNLAAVSDIADHPQTVLGPSCVLVTTGGSRYVLPHSREEVTTMINRAAQQLATRAQLAGV